MKKFVLLMILGTAAMASIWSWQRPDHEVELDRRLIADRLWIDHIPRNDKDVIHLFAMLSEQSAGVFQATSQWRGNYEVFRYEAQGGELRLVYPQTGDRETARAKARRCNEGGMDFCLELEGASRGVKKYYSRKGWEIDGAPDLGTVKQRLDALHTRLLAAE